MSDAQVQTLAVEALGDAPSSARVQALAVEALGVVASSARVALVGIEVLRTIGDAPAPEIIVGRRRQLIMG